jgi:hypothetical protein
MKLLSTFKELASGSENNERINILLVLQEYLIFRMYLIIRGKLSILGFCFPEKVCHLIKRSDQVTYFFLLKRIFRCAEKTYSSVVG